MQAFGTFFLLVVVIFNLVVILNLVIAIMASTYNGYKSYTNGLYLQSLVQKLALYRPDKRYDALMCAYPPFNLLLLVLSPIVLLFDKESPVLVAYNYNIKLLMYLPIALLLILLFVAVNIVLLPFAFALTVYSKLRHSRDTYKNLLVYLVFGVFILLN